MGRIQIAIYCDTRRSALFGAEIARARTLRVTRGANFVEKGKVSSPLPASTRRPFSLGVHEDEPADDANLAA